MLFKNDVIEIFERAKIFTDFYPLIDFTVQSNFSKSSFTRTLPWCTYFPKRTHHFMKIKAKVPNVNLDLHRLQKK